MKIKILSLFLFITCLLSSCSDSAEDSVCTSNIDNSEYSPILTNDFLQISTLQKLELINDSVCSSSIDSAEGPLNLNNNLVNEVIIADTQGFYDGVRYGWSVGKGFGKVGNAALFGTLFAAGYSAVAFLFEGISALVDYFTDCQVAMRAASHVYSNDNLTNICQTELNNYKVEYSKSEISILTYSYCHNEILHGMRKNAIEFHVPLDSVFSSDQILILNSEDFKNNFADIQNRVGNISLDFVEAEYSYETQIFSRYLRGLSLIKSNNFRDSLKKVSDLRKEYAKVINEDSMLSQEHKDGLNMAFGVTPFSLIYWNTQLSQNER